jgi:hypothetical protein
MQNKENFVSLIHVIYTGKTVVFQQKAHDPDQINSALENYYQVSRSFILFSLLLCFIHLFDKILVNLRQVTHFQHYQTDRTHFC